MGQIINKWSFPSTILKIGICFCGDNDDEGRCLRIGFDEEVNQMENQPRITRGQAKSALIESICNFFNMSQTKKSSEKTVKTL